MKHLWGIALLAAVVAMNFGCGSEEELPDKPQIQPDRTALFIRGGETPDSRNLWVDTQNMETLMIRNEGLEQLRISKVFITGDNKNLFQASLTSDTVESREVTFVVVVYSPTAQGTHKASLVIESNSEINPTLTLEMAPTAELHHHRTRGIVEDSSSGEPVSGAKVTCMRRAGQLGWETTTDSSGIFSVEHTWSCEKILATTSKKTGEIDCNTSVVACIEGLEDDSPTTGIVITIDE
jgi:hypothetical protein